MIAAFLFASTVSAPAGGSWVGTQAEPAGEPRTSEGYAIPAVPQVPDGPCLVELAGDAERLVREFDSAGATPNAK